MFDVDYDFGMCNISVEQSETTNSGLAAIDLETVGLTVFQFCPAAFCLFVCLCFHRDRISPCSLT